MSNAIQTVKSAAGLLAKAAAKELVDNLQFCKSIDKADESDYKGKNGYSAGDTIYITKPARFIPITSFDITSSINDFAEEKVALVLDTPVTVSVSLDSQELASTIDVSQVYNRAIKPAIHSIAQTVESTFLTTAVNATYNTVGTAGSTVFNTNAMMDATARLGQYLAPTQDRFALLDPIATQSAVVSRKGLFQSSSEIAKQYKDGVMGMADGFAYLSNNLLPTHTRGTQTGSLTVATTSVNAATTIALTGTSGGTLKAGDVFTVANVFAVHPITKVTQSFLQQFVVTADNTASGTAYTGVAISPTIYDATTGKALQNVNRFPTSADVVTLVGSLSTGYTQNLCFQKGAFRMVSVPLIMPEAVEFAEQATHQGITVAIVRAFDVLKRRMITRVDFLGGITATRPEWACRVTS